MLQRRLLTRVGLLNPQALQQVLVNLLVNALDATADHPAPRLTIRTRRDGLHCVIEVSDNGTGIAPEHLPRLFKPFFTTKPVGQGTGLGLSICARLIREQDGVISVRSAPRQGATFTIHLPSTGPTPTQSSSIPAAASR